MQLPIQQLRFGVPEASDQREDCAQGLTRNQRHPMGSVRIADLGPTREPALALYAETERLLEIPWDDISILKPNVRRRTLEFGRAERSASTLT